MPNATDSEYNYYSANFLKCMHNNRTELLFLYSYKEFSIFICIYRPAAHCGNPKCKRQKGFMVHEW